MLLEKNQNFEDKYKYLIIKNDSFIKDNITKQKGIIHLKRKYCKGKRN